MQIAIRVDASHTIGTGHVMRCLTLAHALRQRQHDVCFICRQLPDDLTDTIQQQGFSVHILPTHDAASDTRLPHADWLPVSQQTDARQTLTSLEEHDHIDWLIMDHYALDQEWQQIVKPAVNRLMVIDDLADRTHLADILLDQNYYPDMYNRYKALLPSHCTRLIGPQWALLRNEFIDLQNRVTPRTGNPGNVLVFFGGADNSKLAVSTLQAIEALDTPFTTRMIIANTHPDIHAITDICNNNDNIELLGRINNMAELMLQADLAIGAGGTTTWERCYLGLPAIVFTLAQNQTAVNLAVSTYGACLLAGDTHTPATEIASVIQKLVSDTDSLNAMSRAALALMKNHSGAEGIAEIMEQHDD